MVTTAAVFLSFLAHSAARSPVPGVGEPHYLAKAKRYWNPDWCPNDFFLDSADTHRVFYQTVGALTNWLTLEQTAWAGRAAALLLLAVGWTALVSRLHAGRWSPLWTAWVFLALAAAGDWSMRAAWRSENLRPLAGMFDLSGEWIVGGVEAKVFAWGLLFWGLAFIADGRWNRAALCGGLSVAFHPVVGIWGAAAAGFAGLAAWWSRRRRLDAASGGRQPPGDMQGLTGSDRPVGLAGGSDGSPPGDTQGLTGSDQGADAPRSPRRVLAALALFAIAALPGLVPALAVAGNGSPQADAVLVFDRLKHHLDPMAFLPAAWVSAGLLVAFWLVGRRRVEFRPFERWFAGFVLGTGLIALGGLIVGSGPRPYTEMPAWEFRVGLMKFYPFRMADILVPMAGCLVAVGLVEKRLASLWEGGLSPWLGRLCQWQLPAWLLFGAAFVFALTVDGFDRYPSRMGAARLADWQDACRWIAAETPEDALFLTTAESFAFKWYAGRAEYFAWKDVPQDAAGILEWSRRKRLIGEWSRRHYAEGYGGRPRGFSAEAVRELQSQTGITHVLAHRNARFELPRLYENGTYAVYRVE